MSHATEFLDVSPVDTTAPGRNSPVAGAPPLSCLVAAARELVPTLRERAQATEQARRISPEIAGAPFAQARFSDSRQPARCGSA